MLLLLTILALLLLGGVPVVVVMSPEAVVAATVFVRFAGFFFLFVFFFFGLLELAASLSSNFTLIFLPFTSDSSFVSVVVAVLVPFATMEVGVVVDVVVEVSAAAVVVEVWPVDTELLPPHNPSNPFRAAVASWTSCSSDDLMLDFIDIHGLGRKNRFRFIEW
jgi:hypothetical protein